MFLTSIFYTFPLKKITSAIVLFCFLLNGISPAFAAWDDYEQGRTAFEQGNYRQAYHTLKNVSYSQALPYLEALHSEGKSRGKADRTDTDLSPQELEELEGLLTRLKEHPRYHAREDHDLSASKLYRQYLKELNKTKGRKKPPSFFINERTASTYAIYLSATTQPTREGISLYATAMDRGELSAFRKFAAMGDEERSLFPHRSLYEKELEFLNLGKDGIFDRMYILALSYRKKADAVTDNSALCEFYFTRYSNWLKRAAKRGNILRAQQEILCLQHPTPEILSLTDEEITTFPSFPTPLEQPSIKETPTKQPTASLSSHQQDTDQLAVDSAISLIACAADNGDRLAACVIGQYYEDGRIKGTPSPEKAFFWYTRAHELGDINGLVSLARCHEHAIGTKENKPLARALYRQAAQRNHPTGIYNTAIMALQANDFSEAQHWLEKSVSQRYPNSYPKLAELYTSNPGFENYERAAQLMRILFSASNFANLTLDAKASADNAFTVLVHRNIFSELEEKESFKFARFLLLPKTLSSLAYKYIPKISSIDDSLQRNLLRQQILEALLIAQQNEALALRTKCMLGVLTIDWSPSAKETHARIIKGLEDLSENPDISYRLTAHLALAQGYHFGLGILPRDEELAIKHYRLACDLYSQSPQETLHSYGYTAFLNIGILLASFSPGEALRYTEQACEIPSLEGPSYATAYFNRATLYRDAETPNPKEAFRYMSIAAGEGKPVYPAEGDPDAHHDLGLMYLYGNEYLSADLNHARSLFKKATEANLPRSFLSLAGTYLSPPFGKRDILQAVDLLKRGSDIANDPTCSLLLGYIYLIGETGVMEPNVEEAMKYVQRTNFEELEVREYFEHLTRQSRLNTLLSTPKKHTTTDNVPTKTKGERLLEGLQSTTVSSDIKWRKVEKLLSRLMQLQGGSIKTGSGSVRHLQIGDTHTSMHEVHQPGKGRGLGHGRRRDIQTLVEQVVSSSDSTNASAAAAASTSD